MGKPRPVRVGSTITWLLYKAGVSWGYYVGEDTCIAAAVRATRRARARRPSMNPLPGFRPSTAARQLDNIRPNTEFFRDAANGDAASGVVGRARRRARASIRPTRSSVGQAWVTTVVNAVMQGPEEQWLHTAIFLTWDDWGGFYDHVKPPVIDENGLRPAGARHRDQPVGEARLHRLTRRSRFDAYLKLIEDRFLGGQRLDPQNRRVAGLAADGARGTCRSSATSRTSSTSRRSRCHPRVDPRPFRD